MTLAQKKSREKRIRRNMADGMAGTIKTLLEFQGVPESAANLTKLILQSRQRLPFGSPT
jgi:hypothetical protein